MRVVLLGPPGAGKGTQARDLAVRWGVPQIATGDMLRAAVAAGTALGRRAKGHMEAGELVPDAVIIGLVGERLAQTDARRGFVLDGYPRTAAQSEALDRLLAEREIALEHVLLFELAEDVVIARLTGRRVCRQCGRNYHLRFSPPARPATCDQCGGELYQRADDEEDTVRRRLEVYGQDTKPVVDYYRQRGLLRGIRADGSVEEVREALLQATEGTR